MMDIDRKSRPLDGPYHVKNYCVVKVVHHVLYTCSSVQMSQICKYQRQLQQHNYCKASANYFSSASLKIAVPFSGHLSK